MNKLSRLRKCWISFTYQFMSIIIIWQYLKMNDFQIDLHRPSYSCFVNNYSKIGLSAWQANMDIQPVFNEHKAIAYMCAYLCKSEESCSYATKQAFKISIENKENSYEQKRPRLRHMHSIGNVLCRKLFTIAY